MKEKNAIDFLLYSYFEITLDSEENDIIKATINRAFRDASSRVLSITDETNVYYVNGDKNQKKASKQAASDYLLKRIKEDLNSNFKNWFNETCNLIENTYYEEAKNKNGNKAFNFGHAQKWVNMTMKYLYMIKSVFEKYDYELESDIFKKLSDDLEKQLHIPIDSYIMEAVSSELGVELPRKDGGNFGKYNSSTKAWSKWTESDYNNFRKEIDGNAINEKIMEKLENKFATPLDWEGSAWIKISKERKSKY